MVQVPSVVDKEVIPRRAHISGTLVHCLRAHHCRGVNLVHDSISVNLSRYCIVNVCERLVWASIVHIVDLEYLIVV